MITIEGLGGKGTLWCIFRTPVGMALPASSTLGYDLVTANEQRINPIAPFECYLPPVGAAGVWYDCEFSQYGPRVTKVDIGTLIGETKSPNTPNPCEHSTIVGTLVKTSLDPLTQLRFLKPYVTDVSATIWYTPLKRVAQFIQGKGVMSSPSYQAYNRFGVLKPYSIEGVNSAAWYDIHSLFTDCADPLGLSTPVYADGAKFGMWLSNKPIVESFLSQTLVTRTLCTHVSARVWKYTTVEEIHHNASYTPASSVSRDSGLGYLVSSVKRERTCTMTHIQSVAAADFRAKFTVHEEVSWYGWDHPKGSYSGSCMSDYSFSTSVLGMFPGTSLGGSLPVDAANAYCAIAPERAKLLFKHKSATIARSNAIADVPGLESNWLENLTQIGGTADVVAPLLLGLKAVRTGDIGAARRALAGAYLSYKYVVAPGIRDYKDVSNNIGTLFKGFTRYRFSNERRRGILHEETSVLETSAKLTYSCTLNLKLKDNPYAAIFNALEKLGLDPSAGNLWDLIPFSFVVDWFTNIGPVLSRADALQNNVVLRDVTSRIESFKVQWPIAREALLEFGWTAFAVSSPINYNWYDRRILSGLGSFDALAGQTPDGLSVSQMTQGGALLSSYRK